MSLIARVTKFGMEMHMDAIWVDLDGQGHRSKVKVTRPKNFIYELFVCMLLDQNSDYTIMP